MSANPTTPARSPEEIDHACALAEEVQREAAEARAAAKRAATAEHQRLSAAIQEAARAEDYSARAAYQSLPAWQTVINLAREISGAGPRHERSYAQHLRFLAFRDAADAIARLAIGEA